MTPILVINHPEDAQLTLNRVKMINPPFPVRLEISLNGLLIHFKVKDRDNGSNLDLTFSFEIPYPISDYIFLEFVESRVRAAWLHEFRESFHIDGRRVDDPHPTGTGAFDLNGSDLSPPMSTDKVNHL